MMKPGVRAFPPQIDAVKMLGQYTQYGDNESARVALFARLVELGERPFYRSFGTMVSKLHNPDGTHALRLTMRGSRVEIVGSLAKWGGVLVDGRYTLPDEDVPWVVLEILERLDLDSAWVMVHAVEYGVDVLVAGKASDYTAHLRIARGNKRQAVKGEKDTHYQGNARGGFKAYDKGREAGIQTPEGYTLLRFERRHKHGASSIGKALGLGAPLQADALITEEVLSLLKQALYKTMEQILPEGVPAGKESSASAPLDVAVQLLQEALGDRWLPDYLSALEERANNAKPPDHKRRIRDKIKEVMARYSNLDTERFDELRRAIAEARE